MLAETIESVLNQRNVDLEVIVIDDCSTDGTEEFVKGLNDERIRYIRNEKNSGLEYNRNSGLRNARGKYITWIDDDDYYTDYDFFSKAIKIFEENDSEDKPLAVVCANSFVLDIKSGKKKPHIAGRPGRVDGLDFALNSNGKYGKPSSTFPAVYKADALRQAGLNDLMIFDSITSSEAALFGDAWYMPDKIGVYRIGHSRMTIGRCKEDTDYDRRHYEIMHENIRRWRVLRDKLEINHRSEANKLYLRTMTGLVMYYAKARPSLKDRRKVLAIIRQESGKGFMSKLWAAYVWALFKRQLIKITPLRRVYRKIKYGDSHYGEY